MSHANLTLTTKGEVKIGSSYSTMIEVTIDNVDIDDVISEIGIGELLDHMDIDEVISEMEAAGYKVSQGE